MKFSRGDLVLAASPGDYGKPRPCLVLQHEFFDDLPSVTLCLVTTTMRDDRPLVRITIEPNTENGLRHKSQISVDKITTLPLARVARKIGTADEATMLQVSRALAVFFGLG